MKEEECKLRQTLTVDEMTKLIKEKAANGQSLIETSQPNQCLPTQSSTQSSQSQYVLNVQSFRIVQSFSIESIHDVSINGSIQSYSESVYSEHVQTGPIQSMPESVHLDAELDHSEPAIVQTAVLIEPTSVNSDSVQSESVHSEPIDYTQPQANEATNIQSQLNTQNLSPKTRQQIQVGFSSLQQRAQFMFSSGYVKLSDESKDIYLVTNERNDVHMVKLLKNTCTCFASKSCAHIFACRLFKGERIESLIPKDLTQSLIS